MAPLRAIRWLWRLPGRIFGRVGFTYTPPEWTGKLKGSRQETPVPGAPPSSDGSFDDPAPQPPRFWVKVLKRLGTLWAPVARFIAPVVQWVRDFYRWDEEKKNRSLLRRGLTVFAGLVLLSGIIFLVQEPADLVRISVTNPSPKALEEGAGIPPLTVLFTASAARIDLAGKPVPEGITVDPPLEGRWTWTSDTQLLFFPSVTWKPDEAYTVTFDRSLFRDGLNLASTQVRFSTPPFQVSFQSAELYTDPRNPRERKIVGTLSFNYPVDAASFQNAAVLTIKDGKNLWGQSTLPLEISYDKFFGKAYLASPNLAIPADTITAQLSVRGGVKPQGSDKNFGKEITREITLPGVYDFVQYTGISLPMVRNDSYEMESLLSIELSNQVFPTEIANNLRVWMLPKDRIGIPGYEDEKDHQWGLEEVDPKLLKRSEVLSLDLAPSPQETATVVSFRYRAPTGRMLYVEAKGELQVFGDYKIRNPLKTVARVPQISKTVTIMSEGALLSLGGEKTISLVSNDLSGLHFEVNRLLPDQVNHLVTQASGDLAHLNFDSNYRFDEDNMSAYYSEKRPLTIPYPGAAQYSSFDFTKYLARTNDPALRNGLFLFRASELLPEKAEESLESDYEEGYEEDYYGESSSRSGVQDRRFILVTDLGILVKKGNDGRREVFVQDIRTGGPRSEVQVKVLGKNGLPVFTGLTDAQGRVTVPNVEGYQREQRPVVITAEAAGDFSFLPLSTYDRFLNYSRFDVGGVRGATLPETLNAFLFSDRGLYRPGDKMNIGFIIKSGDWNRNLAGLPLEATILDPRGVEVYKKLYNLHPSGFEELSYRSFDTSPTGTWQVNLSLVKPQDQRQLLGTTTVRVEEFQPDRLAVSSYVENAADALWVPFGNQKVLVQVNNLYGLPAAGNRVSGTFRLSPQYVVPPGYRDYTFMDGYTTDKYYEETLNDQTTDDQGRALFDIDLSAFAPATYKLTFQGDAQEKSGGRGVVTETSVTVSPLSALVGYKADGSLSYIAQGGIRQLEFIGVNAAGKKTGLKGLSFQVDEIKYVSVLTKREDGTYRYESVEKKNRIKEGAFTLPPTGTVFDLDTTNPGDYEVRLVEGEDKRVVSRVNYTVVGRGNLSRSLDRNAELQIKLDRDSYSPGEEIQLQIKAPYTGAGVITIEREKVYGVQWFKADTTTSLQTITVPEGLEGTAYINVSFIRGLDSREIFTSPLSYGVAPFKVNLGRRTVGMSLSSPDQAKPGQPYPITFSTDRKSRIVVFAVDEGILQLARYQTPRPLDHFFRKQALEVQTSQILDLILPEFSLVKEASAMGGGGGDELNRNLNPFKRKTHEPVAFWSGILDSDTQPRTVTYNVPSWFNGTMRVMAVAVAPDALGSTQKSALVRSDFILTPTLPLFTAPGDEFTLGVTVANNAGNPGEEKEIQVRIDPLKTTEGTLTPLGPGVQTVKLKRQAETTVWFKLKAGPLSGEVSVKITALSGTLSSTLTESMSVRPALPYRAVVRSGIQPRGTVTLPVDRSLQPQLRRLELSLSYLPTALTPGLLRYLEDYPYGCTEQVVSQSFPLIKLARTTTPEKAQKSWESVLNILKARQNPDGGIGLWSANRDISPFTQAYAVHYLMEAAALGYKGGEGVKVKALAWLESYISQGGANNEFDPTAAAYGLYLLTLNQKVTTNALADLRSRLDRDYSWWKKDMTALYLAGTYALLQKEGDFRSLIKEYQGAAALENYRWYASRLYGDGLALYLLAKHGKPEDLSGQGGRVRAMAEELKGENYTSLSAVFAILGFQAYQERLADIGPVKVKVTEVLAGGRERPLTVPENRMGVVTYSPDATALKVENQGSLDLFWQQSLSGFDLKQPEKPLVRGLEINREYRDSTGKTVNSFQRGQEYTVVIKARALKGLYRDVVINDLLPGGCEVVLDREGNRSFDQTLEGTMNTAYGEAREDRVLIMTTLGEGLSEARYKIRALNTGTFALPSLTAEDMYLRAAFSQTPGGILTVTE